MLIVYRLRPSSSLRARGFPLETQPQLRACTLGKSPFSINFSFARAGAQAQGGQAQPRRRTRASSSFGPFQAVAQLIRTLCVAMVEKLLPAFAMLVGGSLIGLLAIVVFKPLAQVGGVLPQVMPGSIL